MEHDPKPTKGDFKYNVKLAVTPSQPSTPGHSSQTHSPHLKSIYLITSD